jgi:hypothetical protein
MESSAKTRFPLHSIDIIYSSPSLHITLQIGIIFHSYLLVPMGAKGIGLIKSPLLAIHAKGGKSISPKQKNRITTQISKFSK